MAAWLGGKYGSVVEVEGKQLLDVEELVFDTPSDDSCGLIKKELE